MQILLLRSRLLLERRLPIDVIEVINRKSTMNVIFPNLNWNDKNLIKSILDIQGKESIIIVIMSFSVTIL